MTGPLAHLSVIDWTTVMMGPYITQIMADLGAHVVKVESPDGDPVREIGPQRSPGMGALYLQANRGKQSIVLDLKHPAGKKAFLKLVERSDLLVTNIRPRAIERLNLQYNSISEVNPRLIYAALLGYGRDGPYAGRPAYDDLIQGIAGLPSLFYMAGANEPRYVPLTFADRVVGLYGLSAILAALSACEQTGTGQQVDIPMFEVMAHFVLADHMGGKLFDPPLGSIGYARLLSKGRRPFRTKDGYVCVLMISDAQWRRFFSVFSNDAAFEADPRFATMATRLEHADSINELVAQKLAQHTTQECITMLESVDIPVMRLNTIDQLIDDPHLAAVNFFQSLDHPTEGKLRMPRVPVQFSETDLQGDHCAPRLGEHSREILRSLGYSDADVDEMRKLNITADH